MTPLRANTLSLGRHLPIRLLLISILVPLLMLITALSTEAKRGKKKKDIAYIECQVTDLASQPLAGIQAEVIDSTGNVVASGVTNKAGELDLEVAAGGEFQVRFAGEGWAPFETRIELEVGTENNVKVSLIDSATTKKQDAIKAFNAGATANSNGDFKAAEGHFRRALEFDGTLEPAQLGLAAVLLAMDDAEAAILYLEPYLANHADDEAAVKIAFEAYRKVGNEERAEAMRGQIADPNFARQLAIEAYNEGVAATQAQDFTLAAEHFEQAAAHDPEMVAAYTGLAMVHYNAGREDDALAATERALAIDSSDDRALRVRYLALDAKADPAAGEAWDAYRQVAPEQAADLLYQRADLDFRAGDSDTARQAIERVLEAAPDHPRAHMTLGLIYVASDAAKARQYLERFIELAPDDPEVASARDVLGYL